MGRKLNALSNISNSNFATCLCVADFVEFGVQLDHLQTNFSRFLFVWFGFHLVGRQNHVTGDCNLERLRFFHIFQIMFLSIL